MLQGTLQSILNKGSKLRGKVTGRSMSPMIKDGEIVTVERVPSAALKTGDLILFKTSREFLILHRVIKKRRAKGGTLAFQTKGDALLKRDEPVSSNQVLGKVCKIEKVFFSSEAKCINLKSMPWRAINCVVFLIQLIKSLIKFRTLISIENQSS